MSDGNVERPAARTVELHSLQDRFEIAPGVLMPRLGFGMSHVVGGPQVERTIRTGIRVGYRLIDTATAYRNESDIGAALKKMRVSREELFVTSKVWPSDQGYEPTMQAFETSRTRLGLDYLDLYLIHWPEPRLTSETWRAFEKLRSQGMVRAIGVSNFMREDLERLYLTASVPPAVNQIEFHPHLQRPALVEYCRSLGIAIEAWSPLMRGKVADMPQLVEIGERHGKSAAQVTIRWILQKGILTIPKSSHEDRLWENADVFDFALSAEEMASIDHLNRDQHEK